MTRGELDGAGERARSDLRQPRNRSGAGGPNPEFVVSGVDWTRHLHGDRAASERASGARADWAVPVYILRTVRDGRQVGLDVSVGPADGQGHPVTRHQGRRVDLDGAFWAVQNGKVRVNIRRDCCLEIGDRPGNRFTCDGKSGNPLFPLCSGGSPDAEETGGGDCRADRSRERRDMASGFAVELPHRGFSLLDVGAFVLWGHESRGDEALSGLLKIPF